MVSPLLYACYQNSQSISRAYEQYGASAIQPISEEMQLLLTVYYLVQLGESLPLAGTPGGVTATGVVPSLHPWPSLTALEKGTSGWWK